MKTIDSFTGPYFFLSNFYSAPIVHNKILYPTVEHAYQACKSLKRSVRLKISYCRTAYEAKKMGETIELRENWHEVRIPIMTKLHFLKFNIIVLQQALSNTKNSKLVEGNQHGDIFWGVCNGVGANHNGKSLMYVRSIINSIPH